MKYDLVSKVYGIMLTKMVKHDIKDKNNIKKIKKEYKEIVKRSKDIGKSNNLRSSYLLCSYFIALVRNSGLKLEECYKALEQGMRKSKLLKIFMGDAKSYFSSKHMDFRRRWSSLTKERRYENDWVVNFIEKADDFEFGFDYLECGVCKLCQDENCFHLAKYLCRLDYLLVDIMGIKLKRTKTLANGDDCCDFRFMKK